MGFVKNFTKWAGERTGLKKPVDYVLRKGGEIINPIIPKEIKPVLTEPVELLFGGRSLGEMNILPKEVKNVLPKEVRSLSGPELAALAAKHGDRLAVGIDARDGRVRVLHSISFIDDPTRMLRAVRFEQRFGFQIEGRTLELLREALSLIGRISGDRLRHELNHILDEEQRVPMLERLHNLGLLSAIHPCLPWDEWASARLGQLDGLVALGLDPTPGEIDPPAARQLAYCVWLLRLPPEELRSVVSRLRISAVHAREFSLWKA